MHFVSRGLEMRLFSTFKTDLKGFFFNGISLSIRMQTRVAATSVVSRTHCLRAREAVETRFGRRIGG
jgi:hypothetical protein